MKEHAVTALVIMLGAVIAFFVLEGVLAVVENEPSLSLTRRLLYRMRSTEVMEGGLRDFIHRPEELAERADLFLRNRVVLGNTPFVELATDEAGVGWGGIDSPRRFKPEVTIRSGYLRSRIFDALDPIVFNQILRDDEAPDPELEKFLSRYAIGEVVWTTDADGFRTTVPEVGARQVIVLLGSSPCVGAFVADEFTMASLLQERDRSIRFVNACVTWTKVDEHAAMLEELAGLYGERLVGAIYTLNEKNYRSLAAALDALDAIGDILDRVGAGYRAFIYFQYIYETMPDLFRTHRRLDESFANRSRLTEAARERGFAVVDTFELLQDYRNARGSAFAGLALYADHGHFSPEGNRVLVEAIPATPGRVPGS